MNNLTMTMPGALRMRGLYPLLEADGSCSLIYDLERAVVLDVPDELRLHVGAALDTGDLDEALLGWLLSEDLLTADGWPGYEGSEAPAAVASWWSLGLVFRRDGELHARLDSPTRDGALGALEFIFKQSLGATRVTLHLSWGRTFPGNQVLESIVVEANRQATQNGQDLRYELSLDSSAVTPAAAAFLADYPFHVRLHCGTFAPIETGATIQQAQAWQQGEKGVRRLLGQADRLIVQCVLEGPSRLRDLWAWAKGLGIRFLDPVRLEDNDPLSPHLRLYRADLFSIAEEVCVGLGDAQPAKPPVDCQPLSRVVTALMRSEPLERNARLSTEALWGAGDVYPSPEDASTLLSNIWNTRDQREPVEEETLSGPGDIPCSTCWARYLCSHSVLPSSPINASADHRDPDEARCALWRAEVEVGLRFYHRLAHADPIQAMHLFEEPDVTVDRFDRNDPLSQAKVPF